ncbi:Glyoxalase/Bleomycin resistance protein/Dioxygenase superfamily [Sphaerochaeta pleomorpha str. Grapes]|uniref:Glyoxalase/Bleomycin resistance protein/Dioxygenase superfamily n=1 Tax=Sphaerochaeta pleomorpha (strain ATCC BAA-1885 / DSM 22778 / Grapes) TaxID=158190 RepID=G8QYZ6_SPHPG|nr:glyoxalase/bleomycin resistance/extradiol dioxygenase family protein [Sphaerochaeta pleomorpha]AEV30855.1 Glyoxalase/Bleomycin resistance protein/Dioxygenase superfamily [Sphaerochaeta pleomorpha str. Grapes]
MALSEYVLALQHIGIPSSNLDRSSDFFLSLGFSVVQREKLPDSQKRVVFMQCSNVVLEIWEESSMQSPRSVGAIDHIALDVSDIEAAYDEALEMDLSFVDQGIQFLPFGKSGVRYFSVFGPDNVIVEYNQKLLPND